MTLPEALIVVHVIAPQDNEPQVTFPKVEGLVELVIMDPHVMPVAVMSPQKIELLPHPIEPEAK